MQVRRGGVRDKAVEAVTSCVALRCIACLASRLSLLRLHSKSISAGPPALAHFAASGPPRLRGPWLGLMLKECLREPRSQYDTVCGVHHGRNTWPVHASRSCFSPLHAGVLGIPSFTFAAAHPRFFYFPFPLARCPSITLALAPTAREEDGREAGKGGSRRERRAPRSRLFRSMQFLRDVPSSARRHGQQHQMRDSRADGRRGL